MINDPHVPSVRSSAETQSQVASRAGRTPARVRMFGRTTMATALMMAAVAALAMTSVVQSNERATVRSSDSVQSAQPTSTSTMPISVRLDSGEFAPFAFGYLVFENDPADGVPGFGPVPPRSPAQ
jgi:hypothetical protein